MSESTLNKSNVLALFNAAGSAQALCNALVAQGFGADIAAEATRRREQTATYRPKVIVAMLSKVPVGKDEKRHTLNWNKHAQAYHFTRVTKVGNGKTVRTPDLVKTLAKWIRDYGEQTVRDALTDAIDLAAEGTDEPLA